MAVKSTTDSPQRVANISLNSGRNGRPGSEKKSRRYFVGSRVNSSLIQATDKTDLKNGFRSRKSIRVHLRLDVGLVIHHLPKAREFGVNQIARTILISEWAVFGDAVPWI